MALVFKHLDLSDKKVLELSLYMLVMYIPFILAEITILSGIVTIFFTGMSARRYIEPNVSNETKQHAMAIFKVSAYLAETCIFLELGLKILAVLNGNSVLALSLLPFFRRAVSIYPLSALFNLSLQKTVDNPLLEVDDLSVGSESSGSTASLQSSSGDIWQRRMRRRRTPEKRKDKQIPASFMHVLWFAGGLRGAVAYACARSSQTCLDTLTSLQPRQW
jgi:NhaP-type Na+/H+ or K+/H+ antiporter